MLDRIAAGGRCHVAGPRTMSCVPPGPISILGRDLVNLVGAVNCCKVSEL